jgi:hypothetical protein
LGDFLIKFCTFKDVSVDTLVAGSAPSLAKAKKQARRKSSIEKNWRVQSMLAF